MNSYFVVQAENLTHAAEDWLSQEAFGFGASGISEMLPFHQPEGEEDVYTQIPDRRTVEVYFEQSPPSQFMIDLQRLFPETQVKVREEQPKDWLEEWKKGFAPFALVRGHWVVPSWCERPSEAKQEIRIDPGMAFGTGTHATTQLMAEALVRVNDLRQVNSCLDVGTGSGILTILAHQLGIQRLVATEIETDARRVAHANFQLNGCTNVQLDERQIETLSEKFEVVMANIIDGTLIRLQTSLFERVQKGGWLMVSGIILEREPDFLAGFHLPPNHDWAWREQRGDWLSFGVKL